MSPVSSRDPPKLPLPAVKYPRLTSSAHDNMATEKLSSKAPTTNINCSFDQDDAVALHVGPTEHAILAHGNFISRRSEFFKAALKKEWAEGQTRIIKLPDEEPRVVTYYLSYAYSKCLPTDIFTADFLGTFPEESDEYYQLLADLYTLGERLLDETICGAITKEFIRLTSPTSKSAKRYCPMKEAVSIIYRGTTAGSPARRLMVDIHLAYGTTKWLASTCEAGFVLDVAQGFYAKFDQCSTQHSISQMRSITLQASDYIS